MIVKHACCMIMVLAALLAAGCVGGPGDSEAPADTGAVDSGQNDIADDPPAPWTGPMKTFSKTLGGERDEFAMAVQQTSDNGYVLAGKTTSTAGTDSDIYLARLDDDGRLLWSKTFGGRGNDVASAVLETGTGDLVVAGYTQSSGAGGKDMYLIKTDAQGNQLWSRTFGGAKEDTAVAVLQAADGGFVLAGGTESFGAGGRDMYLVKTNASGGVLWFKTFGSTGWDLAFSVAQAKDGGFILAGESSTRTGAYLVKTDGLGNLQWTQDLGGALKFASQVRPTRDGGYVITGITNVFGAETGDIGLVKTNSHGVQSWAKVFGGSGMEFAYGVAETLDHGFILAGTTKSFGAGGRDLFLWKTDANGTELWSKFFGGLEDDAAYAVQQTKDSGFVVAGEANSRGVEKGDIFLLKTDPNGNLL